MRVKYKSKANVRSLKKKFNYYANVIFYFNYVFWWRKSQ